MHAREQSERTLDRPTPTEREEGYPAAQMPRDPNVPDFFDVYTMVVLRRPANAPQMSDAELDELQARHLAYRADLKRQGKLVANGPSASRPTSPCAASRSSPRASRRPPG